MHSALMHESAGDGSGWMDGYAFMPSLRRQKARRRVEYEIKQLSYFLEHFSEHRESINL